MAQDSWHNGSTLQAADHLCDAASHARSVDIATPECRDGRDTDSTNDADADREDKRTCEVTKEPVIDVRK